ncbi:hypothetical protein [Echinicola vietnamensis]|uniref:HD domain-containing protein n=1 Tax=Echinicola vietnamensis (strain DSM 17526 / LMG 23754 / KMM 6221) TaxID=926556 RepID=L0G1X4_ECHVK|nr:hypothetical protein [Echinicola vietnamensis]AGA78860.1 hypothetical protein Echvi_2618 [Echinicola vietnamensis DSM 17526]
MKSIYNDLGILNSREVSQFKRALLTAKLTENKDRLLTWLGIKSYREADIAHIGIPDSKLATLAIEEANDVYSPSLLKHCYRTYFFSAGLALAQGLKVDEEFLFTTSILHDIGLTEKHQHVCSKQCFAVYGGHHVKDFALKNGTDTLKASKMQTAVDLHLNPHVDRATFGNEAYLLSKGAAMDVIGAHTFQLPLTFIKAIHKRYDRTGFREAILETMTSLDHREKTRADILFKMGFQKLTAKNKLDTLLGG